MRFKRVEWDEGNRGHIFDDHPERELSEEDVEDVICRRCHPTLAVGEQAHEVEVRLPLVGRTCSGRTLFGVVVDKGGGLARPLSVRDATGKALDYYRRAAASRKR